MFCPSCGVKNAEGVQHCRECGAKMPGSSLPEALRPVTWPDVKYTFKHYPASQLIIAISKTLGIICLVFAGLAALGFLIALAKLTSHDDTQQMVALIGVVSCLFQMVVYTGMGVTILYLGESIKVLIDISDNTHRTATAVNELAKRRDS